MNINPIPQVGRKMPQAEQRALGAEFRKILAELLKAGPMTSQQLAEATGSKVQTIRDYMHRMIYERSVVSNVSSCSRVPGGGTRIALYSLTAANTPLPGEVPARVVRNAYPPNKVRDPYALPQAFFRAGAP